MTDVIATIWYVFIDYETQIIYVSEIMFDADCPSFKSYTQAIEYAEDKAAALLYEVIPF